MEDEGDLYQWKSYTAVDFVIGLFITLGASIVNALGLNVTKLDHSRQETLPTASRRPDWQRPFWWLGLLLYIASQVIGSTLALEFLRAEYVAPLGSTSLIFNFVFAYLLVGTPVTRYDIIGTFVIVIGVIGVVVFGNIRLPSDFDKESNLSLSLLKQLWGRADWIAYLTVLEVTTCFLFWFSHIVHEVCMGRVVDERGDADRDPELGSGGRRAPELTGWKGFVAKVKKGHSSFRSVIKRALEKWTQSRPDSSIRKTAGLCWSITGGLLAGQTLVLAKSAVKLVSSALDKSDPDGTNQFTSPLSWVIVILLVISAVTQVYCLNASLKCYDSTFTVPIFFATYTTCGFINSLVYLDELDLYRLWVFLCIWVSIAVLVVGVVLLSVKKPVSRPRAPSIMPEEGEERYDDVAMTPSTPSSPRLDATKKGQGWLGSFKLFGGNGTDGGATPLGSIEPPPGEMTQTDRRRQKGMKKLADVDSVLDSERPGVGAHELELDEVDALSYSARPNGSTPSFDEDDFGDFKHANEEEEEEEERERP